MKHLLALLFCFSLLTTQAQAQTQTKAPAGAEFKIAYFDKDSLMKLMPEFKAAEDSSARFYQRLEVRMYKMNMEYQEKTSAFDAESTTWSAKTRQMKEAELYELGQKIQEYQVNAQKLFEEYKASLMTPVQAKVDAAAKKVANEKGYAFVLDGSKTAAAVIFANQSYNIFDDMCKELGIPVPKR